MHKSSNNGDGRPSILLVDDHPANLVALEAVLGTSDYSIVTASSGREALELLKHRDFALVLLDIQMPGMDGYEVAKRIKASAETRHIPIIFITAIYREDEHVRRGYEAGAIDYFAKPFNADLLRTKVGIYTELYRKNLVLRRKEEERREFQLKYEALHRSYEENRLLLKKEAERRAAELNTVLESIPDAIYVGDEKGHTRCNSAALAMFGLSHGMQSVESLGNLIKMRYPESDSPIPTSDQPVSHGLAGEQLVTQVKIRRPTVGDDRVIACAAAPVVLDQQVIGAVVVNLDVTDELGLEPPKDFSEFFSHRSA